MQEETTALQTQDEFDKLAQQMAGGSGERTESFTMLPNLTVYNKAEGGEETQFKPGDFVKSTKTEQGYQNEGFERPFLGVILKSRMLLRTKMKAKNEGVPNYLSDEFDSYAPGEIITVKEKKDDKYVIDFQGNYKEVQAHYSESNKFGKVNKYLDLQYNLYVLPNLDEPTSLIKLVVKGMSRGEYFDFMKKFTRRNGDFMSATWSQFGSKQHLQNFQGDPLKFPVYSFDFQKGERLTLDELKKAISLQNKLNEAIETREASFKTEATAMLNDGVQPAQEEEIPTINLDDEEVEALNIENPLEEKKEELPKDAQGKDVPFA